MSEPIKVFVTFPAWCRLGWSRVLFLTAGAVAILSYAFLPRHGLGNRVGIPPNYGAAWVLLPTTRSPQELLTSETMPYLRFDLPTSLVAARDGSDRLFVLERRGTLRVFRDHAYVKATALALDISNRVKCESSNEGGAVGFALHPEFGHPNSPHRADCYVSYTPASDANLSRLSQFTLREDGVTAAPESETVLIDDFSRSYGRLGPLAFGQDGLLYVGVAGPGPDADERAFSGILRIDVDLRGGDVSHAPRRQLATAKTAHYYIPNHNPHVDESGVWEEVWLSGGSGPHHLVFDMESNDLYVADTGAAHHAEVAIVKSGSTTPNRLFQSSSNIGGGVVYRGQEYPHLAGKYIFVDHATNQLLACDPNVEKHDSHTVLLDVFDPLHAVSLIGESVAGELLLIRSSDVSGSAVIQRVVVTPIDGTSQLKLLSYTRLFSDLRTLRPVAGFVPYKVQVPLWLDGAVAKSWIYVPGDGTNPDRRSDRISFSRDRPWSFPDGTIFLQQIDLPVDETDPSRIKRIETRVLVRLESGGVYGSTYKWNSQDTDAELLDDGMLEPVVVKTASGQLKTQIWEYPSRSSCLDCHNRDAGEVLGVNTRQLNGDFRYPNGAVRNQLREWNRIGMFTQPLRDQDLEPDGRLVPLSAENYSLEYRVRSYLHANCAFCHHAQGVKGDFDARFQMPLRWQDLAGDDAREGSGAAGTQIVSPGDAANSLLLLRMLPSPDRMPPLGAQHPDYEANARICEWIESLAMPLYSNQLTNEFRLGDEIYRKWIDAGGPNGFLGQPTQDTTELPQSALGTKATMARFQGNGVIFHHLTGRHAGRTFLVAGAINEKYQAMGATDSSLGLPVSDELVDGMERAVFFEGGCIQATDRGVRQIERRHRTLSQE